MPRILVVADKFPPVVGGIEAFGWNLVRHLPESTVVVAPEGPGTHELDAIAPATVVRVPSLRPGPRSVALLRRLVREHDCQAVWFTRAGPLAAAAPLLRRAGAEQIVASTHGQELACATVLPGGRALLRRVGVGVDVLTYLTPWSEARLQKITRGRTQLAQLSGGVDPERFTGADGASVRTRHGLGDDPVIVCVGRLIARKGQDALIKALPAIRAEVPGTRLLLVGNGRRATHLDRLARRHAPGAVVRASHVPAVDLPAYLAAADVFAMPSRTRWGGLDVEGLGIACLEAAAAGLPVVAGRSGGAPSAVIPDQTGVVVDGRDISALAATLVGLLSDPSRARQLGHEGQTWAASTWSWKAMADQLLRCLSGADEPATAESRV
ncbi:MAG TPA: glycosyltransferase family 4 protein [Mycobacteriales bacterium]